MTADDSIQRRNKYVYCRASTTEVEARNPELEQLMSLLSPKIYEVYGKYPRNLWLLSSFTGTTYIVGVSIPQTPWYI